MPEEHLNDPKQEERAQKLFLEIRCIVCNGQVIENSDSQFSYEMRQFVRKEIAKNKSDEEIKDELVQKFGEDILITPNPKTLKGFLLWFLPIVAAVFFAVVMFFMAKNKKLSK